MLIALRKGALCNRFHRPETPQLRESHEAAR